MQAGLNIRMKNCIVQHRRQSPTGSWLLVVLLIIIPFFQSVRAEAPPAAAVTEGGALDAASTSSADTGDSGTETETRIEPEQRVEVQAVHPVISSSTDNRQYRYITLSNHLRVLLISDPVTEKSAAALDVHVGHNQNPWNRPGLAHFLEHMLFLGTRKYPQAGDYPAFISRHGGRYNAYTAPEHTNYFFEIDSGQLSGALDRFSRFFTEPLFNETYVERERNAVDSEYRMRLQDDNRRNLEVYRELMNPNHPASVFTVGNHKTLADAEEEPIREELIRFYQRYYSARLMTLVVLGRESLDELQQMVLPLFGHIPSHNVSLPARYPPLFNADTLPVGVEIKPQKELRQMVFLFPVPATDSEYRKKPYEFIAHVLGHEGEGSAFSFLQQLGWVESLSAGLVFKSRHDAMFQISLDLTEKGLRAKNQIPVVIFHMIRQLESRGLKEWRYQEVQRMAALNFRYQEKRPPLETVRQLAPDMHTYSPQDVLQGSYMYQAYDEKLIRQSLFYLRPDNLLFATIFPEAEGSRTSPHYQTPYTRVSWALEDAEVKPSLRKRLFFPEPNVFIPGRLDVRSRPLLPSPDNQESQQQRQVPQQILSNQRVQVWFQQDQQFNLPRAHMYLRVKSPVVARDAQGAAQAHLFAALVEDQLNEFAWPARLAGLNYSLSAHPRGLDLHLVGYSNRQGLLLNKVAETIRAGKFSRERFITHKARLLREWRNSERNAPYQQLLSQVAALQVHPFWGDAALAAALEDKSWEEFQQFAAALLRDSQLEALFYGNLYRQEAIKLASLAEHQLLGIRTGRGATDLRVTRLPAESGPLLYRQPVNHNDQIAVLYTQALDDTPADAAHMQVLRQILQPAFFDSLRTEQQLGYVVAVVPLPLRTLEGSAFVVQSPATRELELLAGIQAFLYARQPLISAQLAENREAVARRLREPARSMAEQAERFWQAIITGDTRFQRQALIAQAVEAVTEESLRAYYPAVMLNPSRRLWLTSDRMPVPEGFRATGADSTGGAAPEVLVYP